MVSIPVTDDILLRSYRLEDAPELFRAISESRQHLRPWLDWVDKTTKPEHCQQFIEHSLQQLDNQEGLALGIFYKDKIIGGVGMTDWQHATKKAQVGYWISKEQEGKGITSNCLACFAGFLFEKLGLNKIEIRYDPENKRSAKVAEKLGCKVEGRIRQSVLLNGSLQDIIITGLLKSEWKDSGSER